MSKLSTFLVAVVGFASLAGCGTDYTITEQNLAGQIGGVAWSFSSGETNAFLSQDEEYFAELYAESFTGCTQASPTGVDHLILNIPKQTGEWQLSLSHNMTFVVDGPDGIDNLIGTNGLLRVDAVTADSVQGGIYANFDGDNEIDGTFTIAICTD